MEQLLYGQGNTIHVTSQQYIALLNQFQGQTVPAGISRTDLTPGSVGEWLQINVSPTARSSYVCPILIAEGYGERAGNTELRFF
jgi:hypothetical protein